MGFEQIVELAGKALDSLGILIIVGGSLIALARYLKRLAGSTDRQLAYRQGRQSLGRAILLGLELLVAGDIIRTVAISPTFQSVGVLALIVLVRTFLSATLQVEIEGRWPWQGEPVGLEAEQPAAAGIQANG